MSKPLKLFLLALLGLVLTGVPFLAYCSIVLGDLEKLMGQTPESRPSVLYSDYYVLKKGDNFENSFLVERLQNLNTTYTMAADHIQWRSKGFEYPEAVLTSRSDLITKANQLVTVFLKEGRVSEIKVDDRIAEAIAIEPSIVAQIAGGNRSIRDYVKLQDIPAPLLHSFIAIEDQRFLDHPGFDLRSLARAMWSNMRHRSVQGGSTITQQLVKNLLGAREKTITRKMKELVLAVAIEAKYTKDVILEKYLNEVYFGQIGSLEVHGVAEASRYFFNKSLDRLSLAEMAFLAGVIRGPIVYSPYKYRARAIERKNTVLKKMVELKLISPEEHQAAVRENMSFASPQNVSNRAPYFVDYVKAHVLDELREKISAEDLSSQGLRIFTTLDLILQKKADQVVAATVKELNAHYKIEAPLRLEGLLVVADSKTGAVRAIVGGRSYAETTFNRALNMKRQVGSTFKPIVYLAAFLKGKDAGGVNYSPAYPIVDEPWTHEYEGGRSWSPLNYEKTHRGRILLREAFANSINVPMAKIGIDVGMDRVIDLAQKLGVTTPLPNIPSLSLGSVELSAMEVLQVYSTFANRGERVDLNTVTAIVDSNVDATGHPVSKTWMQYLPRSQWVTEPKYLDLLWTLFRSVVLDGTSKAMAVFGGGYKKPAYGKTGTTSFSRDAWFAGFSQGLTAVSWVGFDQLQVPEEHLEKKSKKKFKSPASLTGAGAALPVWTKFFIVARPSSLIDPDPAPEASIQHLKIDRTNGLKAKSSCPADLVMDEVFLPDTAPAQDCTAH